MSVKKAFNIWEGVYSSFQEAPGCGKGFEQEDVLMLKSRKFAKEITLAEQDGIIPSVISYGESLLPFLISVLADKHRIIRVIDFGGGLGHTYFQTKKALTQSVRFKYVIVDQKRVCQEGKKIFKGDKDIFFTPKIPDNFSAHIVHIGSSLQYVECWEQLLAKLSGKCTEYFLFIDLPAGQIPAYVSTQYYYGSRIPYHFFNIQEFIDQMKHLGYGLMFKSSFDADILGKYQNCPQNNFSVKYRLGKACNLFFKRK